MIRPVEIQMVIPRTESVGQIQHQENQRGVQENAQALTQVEKEVKQQSETVIRKDANDFPAYRYDAKEKGNNAYQDNRKKKKKSNQDKNDKTENVVKRTSFDVQI